MLIALLVIVFIIAPELSYKKEDINNINNVSNCTNATLDNCQYCYDQYLNESIQYDPLNILLGIIKGKVNIFSLFIYKYWISTILRLSFELS